jgi:hypothetical protein
MSYYDYLAACFNTALNSCLKNMLPPNFPQFFPKILKILPRAQTEKTTPG